MEGFQKIVLYTAIIILIIVLIIVGIAFSYAKKSNWPPLVSQCPDFWVTDGSGNNSQCINIKNLGICPPQSGNKFLKMNFNEAPFTGNNSTCSKFNWARRCNVTWDGITYGVSNPCG
jgi:hypothetical protein